MAERNIIYLIDLPTYPKGVLSLGIPAVAASFPDEMVVKVFDLNMLGVDFLTSPSVDFENALMIGMKVSSQNFNIAKSVSVQIKQLCPNVSLIWGGELPTLLPEDALNYTDSIVEGAFEPISAQLISDLRTNNLQRRYDGRLAYDLSRLSVPKLEVFGDLNRYYQFMGIPMETSRGCDKKCTFCLVHQMQPKYELATTQKLKQELVQNKGRFVNLVDYNIGVNREHMMQVSELIRESEVLGWMAETCLESLDDDELLRKLSESRCKMIYCGLESIDEASLKSVNKSKTNQLENFERIIRKVQSFGIQIAAGFILGIEGTTSETFKRTMKQFNEWGIIYVKLTFLTYNPGTKVKESMRKKGRYLTEEVEMYDGNHLTFIANDVKEEVIYHGANEFMTNFYLFSSIWRRSKNTALRGSMRWEFVLFALCYRNVYLEWTKNEIFKNEKGFQTLLLKPFRKKWKMKMFDKALTYVREVNYAKQINNK